MSPTEAFIRSLRGLKAGDLGLLRSHSGQGIEESLDGFDLFTGIWWPLRAKSQKVPRREVAWLIAKLYALRPIEHFPDNTLARQLGYLRPGETTGRDRFDQRFDMLISLPLDKVEPVLQWALDLLASKNLKVDWVKLTDDLSIWEMANVRLRWTLEFLEPSKEVAHAN